MKKLLAVLCLVITAGLPAFASVVTISNGDFEIPVSSGTFNTVTAVDSTTIPGWTVWTGSVDHITNYWQAASGIRSIDLDGLAMGSIRQDLTFASGGGLAVDFSMAGNPEGSGLETKSMQVSLLSGAGPAQVFTFDAAGATLTSMGWVQHTANFSVPAAGVYTLEFASLTPGAYGPALDNVSANLPDGGATLLLLGFGLTGLAALRRRMHV